MEGASQGYLPSAALIILRSFSSIIHIIIQSRSRTSWNIKVILFTILGRICHRLIFTIDKWNGYFLCLTLVNSLFHIIIYTRVNFYHLVLLFYLYWTRTISSYLLGDAYISLVTYKRRLSIYKRWTWLIICVTSLIELSWFYLKLILTWIGRNLMLNIMSGRKT